MDWNILLWFLPNECAMLEAGLNSCLSVSSKEAESGRLVRSRKNSGAWSRLFPVGLLICGASKASPTSAAQVPHLPPATEGYIHHLIILFSTSSLDVPLHRWVDSQLPLFLVTATTWPHLSTQGDAWPGNGYCWYLDSEGEEQNVLRRQHDTQR